LLPVLSVVVPVFALILAGFIAGKTGKLGPNASAEINRFVVWLALPAQLFTFTANSDWQTLWQPGFIIAFSAGCFAVYIALLLYRWYHTRDWVAASFTGLSGSYANTGYMGIPLCLLALGDSGLAPAVIATLVVVCGLFGLAIVFIEFGKQSHKPWYEIIAIVLGSLAKNPLLVAPIAGAAWSASGLQMVEPAQQFLSFLAAAASPCALVSIGLFLDAKERWQSQRGLEPNVHQVNRATRCSLASCRPYSRPTFILGSGCRTHERPAHRHRSIYARAVLPSRWLRNLTHRFTNHAGLDRDAVYDHLVDQSDCLSGKTKTRD
jgi:malonate transporter and related proteins